MNGETLEIMLAMVAEKRDLQIARIQEQARLEAASIITSAHRQARGRMREAVVAERRGWERAMQQARSRQETERRRQAMTMANRLLQGGQTLLDQALLDLWLEPAARSRWIGALAERGVAFLPQGAWTVCHPENLPAAECDLVTARTRRAGLPDPLFRGEGAIVAGLRLGCQGAWVDGTVSGLLADRAVIDARLLAMLQPEGAAT